MPSELLGFEGSSEGGSVTTIRTVTASLAEYAAAIAPQIDRLRLGVMRASIEVGMRKGVLAGAGLDPDTFRVFAMLRNAYPDRAVSLESYRAAYLYQEPSVFDTALARMKAAGLVDDSGSGLVTLSDPGRQLIAKVRAAAKEAATGLWGSEPLAALPLADRCLAAATESALPAGAFHVLAPPHDEPDDSDAMRLSERLAGLRWHRFDAHVAAWTAAGFTAATVGELGPGAERERLEQDTNERAGEPYAVLDPTERASLLAALEELA